MITGKLAWDPAMSVGVDAIDVQHREVIGRISDLREAMAGGRARAEVGRMIAFLDEYVVGHFGMEELLMKRRKYDGYLAHRQEHLNFTTEFTNMKQKFETLDAEGAILSFFAIELDRWFTAWFTAHLAGVDTALGEFLMRPDH